MRRTGRSSRPPWKGVALKDEIGRLGRVEEALCIQRKGHQPKVGGTSSRESPFLRLQPKGDQCQTATREAKSRYIPRRGPLSLTPNFSWVAQAWRSIPTVSTVFPIATLFMCPRTMFTLIPRRRSYCGLSNRCKPCPGALPYASGKRQQGASNRWRRAGRWAVGPAYQTRCTGRPGARAAGPAAPIFVSIARIDTCAEKKRRQKPAPDRPTDTARLKIDCSDQCTNR